MSPFSACRQLCFLEKRSQRRSTEAGDGVSTDALSNPTVATAGSQPLDPLQVAFEGNSAPPQNAFPPGVGSSQDNSSNVAPLDLDNVDFWDLGAADDFLSGTYTEPAHDAILPSPSQFLSGVQVNVTPSSTTLVASTDEPRVSPNSNHNGELQTNVRRPLRYRRSAQLTESEGPDPAHQSEADDEGWLGSLHLAALKGSDRMVEVLLQQGLDCNEKDSDGRTPLMHAVIRGHEAVARILVAHGASLSAVDKDARSVLHWAALYRRDELLKMLLERRGSCANDGDKLDIDAYDDSGWTPLHMAIHKDSEAAVRMLLEAGAYLNSKAQKCPFAKKLAAGLRSIEPAN